MATHGRWLYRQGVEHTARLAPELLAEVTPAPTELGDALAALAAAVLAGYPIGAGLEQLAEAVDQ